VPQAILLIMATRSCGFLQDDKAVAEIERAGGGIYPPPMGTLQTCSTSDKRHLYMALQSDHNSSITL
jgi:hypothetical protein